MQPHEHAPNTHPAKPCQRTHNAPQLMSCRQLPILIAGNVFLTPCDAVSRVAMSHRLRRRRRRRNRPALHEAAHPRRRRPHLHHAGGFLVASADRKPAVRAAFCVPRPLRVSHGRGTGLRKRRRPHPHRGKCARTSQLAATVSIETKPRHVCAPFASLPQPVSERSTQPGCVGRCVH